MQARFMYYIAGQMATVNLAIPALGNKFTDIRETVPGDSFNWSWVRPLSQVNYLAIHHSASPDNQTPEEIAAYHINNNGWGGIGYHFCIARNGEVFYVGDISTARANVANMNEQVIGICLIGNFTSGRVPSAEQIDSANKLCDFFINNYPDLSNVNSWDSVKGHKELPGQTTTCPGDNWSDWKAQIINNTGNSGFNPKTAEAEKENFKLVDALQDQVDNLQASLSSVNQQAFLLQETVQTKDREIDDLKEQLRQFDHTQTIISALIDLYKFVLMPGKAGLVGSS